jgi:hypothetical protein
LNYFISEHRSKGSCFIRYKGRKKEQQSRTNSKYTTL